MRDILWLMREILWQFEPAYQSVTAVGATATADTTVGANAAGPCVRTLRRVLAANGVVATVERVIPQPGNNHAVLSEGATVKPHLRARHDCARCHFAGRSIV